VSTNAFGAFIYTQKCLSHLRNPKRKVTYNEPKNNLKIEKHIHRPTN